MKRMITVLLSLSLTMGLYFVVVVSFALAIFNLLPLPVLDGGHIVFGLIELVFRRPLPARLVKVLTMIFVGLLILLMLYVSYFDVRRWAAPTNAPRPAAEVKK